VLPASAGVRPDDWKSTKTAVIREMKIEREFLPVAQLNGNFGWNAHASIFVYMHSNPLVAERVLASSMELVIPRRRDRFASAQIPENADYFAEDADMVVAQRLHGRIFRLQADMIPLHIERLDGRFLILGHGDDDIAVVRRLLLPDNDVIPVVNAGFDHAVADDGKHEDFVVLHHVEREGEIFFNIFHCGDRHAGSNLADQRHPGDRQANHLDLVFFSEQFDGARLGRIPADKPFLLEPVQMSVHGGAGSEADRFADFADGRRIPLLPYFASNKIEYSLLPIR